MSEETKPCINCGKKITIHDIGQLCYMTFTEVGTTKIGTGTGPLHYAAFSHSPNIVIPGTNYIEHKMRQHLRPVEVYGNKDFVFHEWGSYVYRYTDREGTIYEAARFTGLLENTKTGEMRTENAECIRFLDRETENK